MRCVRPGVQVAGRDDARRRLDRRAHRPDVVREVGARLEPARQPEDVRPALEGPFAAKLDGLRRGLRLAERSLWREARLLAGGEQLQGFDIVDVIRPLERESRRVQDQPGSLLFTIHNQFGHLVVVVADEHGVRGDEVAETGASAAKVAPQQATSGSRKWRVRASFIRAPTLWTRGTTHFPPGRWPAREAVRPTGGGRRTETRRLTAGLVRRLVVAAPEWPVYEHQGADQGWNQPIHERPQSEEFLDGNPSRALETGRRRGSAGPLTARLLPGAERRGL